MTEARVDIADECDLLTAARAGDGRAFGCLVDRHRRGLETYCYLMLGCPHEAGDVVHETVLRAWRELSRVEHGGSARTWLYRIATNACLEEIERHR